MYPFTRVAQLQGVDPREPCLHFRADPAKAMHSPQISSHSLDAALPFGASECLSIGQVLVFTAQGQKPFTNLVFTHNVLFSAWAGPGICKGSRPFNQSHLCLAISTRLEESSCAMKVDVHLPSGDSCSISLLGKRPISELKAAAQQHFQRRLKLTAKGWQLDLRATLSEAGLQDGDVVVAVVQPAKLAATDKAFALYGHAGEVVTWGDPEYGGDSSQVQEQLRNVQHIQATGYAFAAILESGAVVTWGDPEYGGDSSQVQEQLANVQHIQATESAFAAILESGAVVTWGDPDAGGDSSQVQEQLRNVKHIQATESAFAAILESGAVVTWGDPDAGGDSSQVQEQLRNVKHIQATGFGAFAAILENGAVVTWGHAGYEGDSSQEKEQLRNVQHIQAAGYAFAAILENGAVVTWGHAGYGGDSSQEKEQLRNVQHIQATGFAFAAILESGAVVTWGDPEYGGDSSFCCHS